MFIHPANKVNTTTVSNIDEVMIQPNTIDLRVDSIYKIENSELTLDEDRKIHRQITPCVCDDSGYWTLSHGSCYQINSNQQIGMGEGELGLVIGRSTFNRNGVLIISSIYDSGFQDYIGATLYNFSGEVRIKHNTRFAHLILAKAETISLYAGDYGKQ